MKVNRYILIFTTGIAIGAVTGGAIAWYTYDRQFTSLTGTINAMLSKVNKAADKEISKNQEPFEIEASANRKATKSEQPESLERRRSKESTSQDPNDIAEARMVVWDSLGFAAMREIAEADSVDNLDLAGSVKRDSLTAETSTKPVLKQSHGNEEIVVRKDELVLVRNIRSVKLADWFEANVEMQSDDQGGRQFAVEFWKSPVNYRGYKRSSNKILLYGIETPREVGLAEISGELYMKYRSKYFNLTGTEDFLPFTEVSDEHTLLQLNQWN